MKHTVHTLLVVFLCAAITSTSCNEASKKTDKETTTTEKDNGTLNPVDPSKATQDNTVTKEPIAEKTVNDLDFLKTLNGKYPDDAKLLENTAFTSRLKKLLGDRYTFLKETWAVETPMEYSNEVFSASACEAHNCGATNFIVVYDFSKNIMYAGIREEEKVKTYAEDGSTSPKITAWEKGN